MPVESKPVFPPKTRLLVVSTEGAVIGSANHSLASPESDAFRLRLSLRVRAGYVPHFSSLW